MAILQQLNIVSQEEGWKNKILNFFYEMVSEIITDKEIEEDQYVNLVFNNNTTFTVNFVDDSYRFLVNDTQYGNTIPINSDSNIIVAYSDSMFWVSAKTSTDTYNASFLYEFINNKRYVSSNSATDFYDFNLVEPLSLRAYQHGKLLNFTCNVGTIGYSRDYLFDGNNISTLEDPNTLQCTTITPGQTITFNSANYYAVASNLLILMDR